MANHNDTQTNDTQPNDTQPNDTQNDTGMMTLSIIARSISKLIIIKINNMILRIMTLGRKIIITTITKMTQNIKTLRTMTIC
jgi:hypothetical protein